MTARGMSGRTPVGFRSARGATRRTAVLAVMLLMLACSAAQAEVVRIQVFWRNGCPHCERLRDFLDRLVARQPEVAVDYHEVGSSAANRDLLARLAGQLGADRIAVPFTVVGDRHWIGYFDDASTGAEIEAAAAACRASGCPDRVASLRDAAVAQPATRPAPSAPAVPKTLRLPLLGEVDTADLSLPLLTVVLGALDGFNPCAMWTLVFLIGLLLGIENRARRWLLGTAFIAASAGVYFLFMAAWLNALLALGLVPWIRAGVGVLAVGGGLWYLVQFARRRDAVCAVTAPAQRQRVFARLRAAAQEQRFWLALVAIVAIAVAVNLVELICSAGIPAVYAQVLALTPMPAWQHHAYLALYIAVFMLDDLLVFVGAMLTLQMAGPAAAWTRWSRLAGGAILLALGVLLLTRPEWLAFG